MGDDSDRVGVVGDILVDYLIQQRKNSRQRKQAKLILKRDEWNNVMIMIKNHSKCDKFKVEDNIRRLYVDNQRLGKSSIELETPQVIIYISNANEEDLKTVFGILQQLKENPNAAIELYKDQVLQEDE